MTAALLVVAFVISIPSDIFARCMLAHPRLLRLGLGLLGLLITATVVAGEVKRAESWMYDRLYAASDKPLLKGAIEADSIGKEALRTLLKYYQDTDKRMRVSVSEDDYDSLGDGNVVSFLRLYGWPKMNETQLVFEPVKPRNKKDKARYRKEKKEFVTSEKRVFQALIALGNAIDSPVAQKSVKDFIASRKGSVLQWDHVFHDSRVNFTTDENSHNCVVRSSLGYRVNGSWSVHTSVTNDRPTSNLRDRGRVTLREVYNIDESTGSVGFLPYMFDLNYKPELKYWGDRPYNRGPNDTFVGTKTASVFGEFGGAAGVRFFISRPVKDNIAVRAALADSEAVTRQVLDTKLWSNTAILLFPLFLALVPLALFADVSDRVLLGYMVFTDFLAVLPLGITGSVLIAAGQREYFSTRTLMRGTPKFVGTTLVASTWSCKCEAAGNITAYGAAFVVIAVLAVVVGVALEFIVKNKVEENNRVAEWKLRTRGCDGEYGEYIWERTGPCDACDCYERSAEAPSTSPPAIGGGLIGQIQQRRKEESHRSVLPRIGIGL